MPGWWPTLLSLGRMPSAAASTVLLYSHWSMPLGDCRFAGPCYLRSANMNPSTKHEGRLLAAIAVGLLGIRPFDHVLALGAVGVRPGGFILIDTIPGVFNLIDRRINHAVGVDLQVLRYFHVTAPSSLVKCRMFAFHPVCVDAIHQGGKHVKGLPS